MEPDLNAILQEQLKGMHMPEAVGWWPIAPGWWLLILATLGLTGFVLWLFIKRQKENLYRKQAISELRAIHHQWSADNDDSQYVQSANVIIKRAINASEKSTVSSSVSGPQWVEILNSWNNEALSEESASALSVAGYQKNPEVNVVQLHKELLRWLRSHKKPADSHNSYSEEARNHA